MFFVCRGSRAVSTEAPDHVCQVSVGEKMLEAVGKDPLNKQWYPFGAMTDMVYDVNGGMEDWMYAAGWENGQQLGKTGSNTAPITRCDPQTYGGYSHSKTKYETQSLRTIQYLVEMSNLHTPPEKDLGHKNEFDEPPSNNHNHVARNLRLALVMGEMAQPGIIFLNNPVTKVSSGQEIKAKFYAVGCEKISKSMLALHKCEHNSFSEDVMQMDVQSEHPDYQTTEVPKIIPLKRLNNDMKCGGLPLYHPIRDVVETSVKVPESLPTGKYCLSVLALFDAHWNDQGVLFERPDPNV